MSVCLMSESCQQKKSWQAPTKHKNIHTFLVRALINCIMVSELPPDCPTLPNGRILMAALVRMDEDRFSSMFLDGIQVRCTSVSSCNVQAGADSVEKFPHRCMNCALKFHLCIICSGSCFGDWYLVVVGGGFLKSMLSEYSQEKFNQYSDNLSSSPLELCWYCKLGLSLSMDTLRSSNGANDTLTKASGDSTLAKASVDTTLAKASGNDHGVLLSSKQHYKKQKGLV